MERFNTIKKFLIENKFIFYIIIFSLGIFFPPAPNLILNILNTTLILAILGILYQIIFPETPLTPSKILSYIITFILLLLVSASIQYKYPLYNLISKYITSIQSTYKKEYIIQIKENKLNGTTETITIIKDKKDNNGSK